MKTFFFYSEIKTSSRQKYSESISLHNVNHSFIYPHNGYVDICMSRVFYSSSSPLFLGCFPFYLSPLLLLDFCGKRETTGGPTPRLVG